MLYNTDAALILCSYALTCKEALTLPAARPPAAAVLQFADVGEVGEFVAIDAGALGHTTVRVDLGSAMKRDGQRCVRSRL